MRDPSMLSYRIAAASGLAAAATGSIALAGWFTGNAQWEAVFTGPITMKTNTAIGIICAGFALYLLSRPERPIAVVRAIQVLAGLVALLGFATLMEDVTGIDLRIDQALFSESGLVATANPNRMGPPASASLLLLGVSMLTLAPQRRPTPRVHQRLAVVVMVLALIPLIGSVLGLDELYGVARVTGISLSAAVVLLVLATGVLLSRPDVGITRQFFADNSGGLLLRRMIPVSIVLPILLSRLRTAGEAAGLYDRNVGRSLLTMTFIIVFSGFTWWTASALQRQRAARLRAEAAERELTDRLAETLESERAARALAERSNRVKDEFLATLSHELRTPLTAITGWVQLLAAGHLSVIDTARAHEAILRNSRLLADLVNDLLDMSRIESGKLRLDMDDVDLMAVIDAAVASAAPAMEAKHLTIDWTRGEGPLIVQGDPARLQQIIGNLLNNSVRFTPKGGRITVSLQSVHGSVEVTVKDTGIGIHRDFLPHVFDRFRQADASTTRSYGGLGLGLAIARQLAERHGGSIAAYSDGEGRGASFTVRLPIGSPASSAATEPVVEPPRLEGVHVLAVDDDSDVCDLVKRVLLAYGAEVTTAACVEDALDRLREQRVDVLVSDLGMPVRDGFDLIREVRELNPTLPAIALTALAREADAARALAAGFQQHLTKPIATEQLVQAVATMFDLRATARADAPRATFRAG
jgi:signal transduction histidine kinase/CheY-like chemotaxis protein